MTELLMNTKECVSVFSFSHSMFVCYPNLNLQHTASTGRVRASLGAAQKSGEHFSPRLPSRRARGAPAGPDQSEAGAGRPPAAILNLALSPHVLHPAGEIPAKQ